MGLGAAAAVILIPVFALTHFGLLALVIGPILGLWLGLIYGQMLKTQGPLKLDSRDRAIRFCYVAVGLAILFDLVGLVLFMTRPVLAAFLRSP